MDNKNLDGLNIEAADFSKGKPKEDPDIKTFLAQLAKTVKILVFENKERKLTANNWNMFQEV